MTDFHTPGAQPPGAVPPKKKMSGCVLAILIVVGLIVALAVLGAIVGGGKPDKVSAAATPSSGNSMSPADGASPDSSWSYTTQKDEVRNATTSYASIASDNKVDFDFPYNGGSTLQMTVRHDHRGDNVYFTISKGQFVCGIETCGGEMNVDGAVRHLSLSSSSDGSSDTLFANGEAGIIKALKSGKKIIVELPFYQSGNRPFTFTTAKGLVWPPAKTADQPAK